MEIPRPPTIKTAGLSSLGPATVEPGRGSAALKSAMIDSDSLTSEMASVCRHSLCRCRSRGQALIEYGIWQVWLMHRKQQKLLEGCVQERWKESRSYISNGYERQEL